MDFERCYYLEVYGQDAKVAPINSTFLSRQRSCTNNKSVKSVSEKLFNEVQAKLSEACPARLGYVGCLAQVRLNFHENETKQR